MCIGRHPGLEVRLPGTRGALRPIGAQRPARSRATGTLQALLASLLVAASDSCLSQPPAGQAPGTPLPPPTAHAPSVRCPAPAAPPLLAPLGAAAGERDSGGGGLLAALRRWTTVATVVHRRRAARRPPPPESRSPAAAPSGASSGGAAGAGQRTEGAWAVGGGKGVPGACPAGGWDRQESDAATRSDARRACKVPVARERAGRWAPMGRSAPRVPGSRTSNPGWRPMHMPPRPPRGVYLPGLIRNLVP
mmetsp:Transcript_21292/g.50455  ORF Transcript_21292/g.50455 Transcript_21292/m.50455 type:complete len:249 (-) Transcript_21292:100-846(-)